MLGVSLFSCPIALVRCYVKDFQNDRKLALETVCFLCDYRDSEELTLTMQKVAELRNDAKALGVKFIHNVKKLELIHKMVAFKCALFWPYVVVWLKNTKKQIP